MTFNPAEIENPYERAFLTWRWLHENEGGVHLFDTEEVQKDLKEYYIQFTKAFEIAWKAQNKVKES